MIDLHTHSLISDGVLLPTELIWRAASLGYRYLALTDHADSSNLEAAVRAASAAAAAVRDHWKIRVLPGVELTHNPPDLIPDLIREARLIGAKVVVVHGETIVEPVPEGTNQMAIAGGADILAHPGLLTLQEAKRAARRGICLELTTRQGHSLTNGHVARLATSAGALLILNTDAHAPQDLMPRRVAEKIGCGAGLSASMVRNLFRNAEKLAKKLYQST